MAIAAAVPWLAAHQKDVSNPGVKTRLQKLTSLCEAVGCSQLVVAMDSMQQARASSVTGTKGGRAWRSIHVVPSCEKVDLVEGLCNGIVALGGSEVGVDVTALELWLVIWEHGPVRYRTRAMTAIKTYLVALSEREHGDVRGVLQKEDTLVERLCRLATTALKPHSLAVQNTDPAALDAAVIMDVVAMGACTGGSSCGRRCASTVASA